jgi:O-antigen ligase
MVTTLMVAVLATKDTTTPTHFSWERRESGVVTQANILASFLTYYMFYFMSFCRMYTDNWRSWLLLLAIYPCGRGVMLTFSRGGYFAFVAGTLFMSYIWKKGLFVAVAIIMIIVWFNQEKFLPGAVVERLSETFEEVPEEQPVGKKKKQVAQSSRGRIDIWQGGIKMVLSNPILGVGYGQFPHRLVYFQPGVGMMDAHNAYILIAAEMGLPTLIIFIVLTARLFKWSMQIYLSSQDRLYAATGMGYAGGMVAFWVSNFFGTRFTTTETISYFWVLTAIIVLIRRHMFIAYTLAAGTMRSAQGLPLPPAPASKPGT